MGALRIDAGLCILRPFEEADAPSLAAHANNRRVWRNLTDRFPHPYTLEDARAWVQRARQAQGEQGTHLAIAVEGRAVGGIGMKRLEDVHRRTAEMGYWLGEAFWGRGIGSAAARAFADAAFAAPDLARLEASVFEWNAASCRVLEKAGFVLEARRRRAVWKDGQQIDSFLYARVR
jgi:RimJ/RimL family protein N-acetyltransferase